MGTTPAFCETCIILRSPHSSESTRQMSDHHGNCETIRVDSSLWHPTNLLICRTVDSDGFEVDNGIARIQNAEYGHTN